MDFPGTLNAQTGADDPAITERKQMALRAVLKRGDQTDRTKVGKKGFKLNKQGLELAHARLALGEEIPQANAFLETFAFDQVPQNWGRRLDTPDWNFSAVRLLHTYFRFRDSPDLSPAAKEHIKGVMADWKKPRPNANRNNDSIALWPGIHTENHDIMMLAIAYLRATLLDRPTEPLAQELVLYFSWRLQKGRMEWNSNTYDAHYFAPALLLAEHAPDAEVRQSARMAIEHLLAERLVFSINGNLAGPLTRSFRLDDPPHDGFREIMWILFGTAPENRHPGEGVYLAASHYVPDPAVLQLASELKGTPSRDYLGLRERWGGERVLLVYHATPHVIMGSQDWSGHTPHQRFFSVHFQNPEDAILGELPAPPREGKSPGNSGDLVQYRNWLVARGNIQTHGNLKEQRHGDWTIYQSGRALVAHTELGDNWYNLQIADLDQYGSVADFVKALERPEISGNRITGRATDGAELVALLHPRWNYNSLRANDQPRRRFHGMLHDSPHLSARWGEGKVRIRTKKGTHFLDANAQLRQLAGEKTPSAKNADTKR
ncbi:MAG: hypothetical protein AAGK14_04740 [Verrucomicrobiota bacterium]